ncbi:hypothetical protein RHGRI_018514 [Rhododendron griersonianum]|uniref:Uncharacterized protein n=1 Tax=Rhododendron griersonianum TaxID=479676 RepID=A0AAV6K1X8_9ERIC|nr:hypothetical protein RHGRI_018514 [Rhododendron griersonianum]KAG5546359.1 hypothetical protein RHGRI_018514 [Rhododendron griersonianum]
MEINSSPTLSLTHGKVPEVTPHRSANFHPSVWGDYFLAYASVAMEPDVKTEQRIEQLKEKVREMIVASNDKPSQKLSLIDAIQRLGVGYHFETEIETTLRHIYETYHEMANDEDLYTVALSFRVLRQQGHLVSCGVFNKLKDNEGKFKESLIGDVRGLLSLYEATHLRVHQEDILDEALEFTTTHLNSALSNLSNNPIAAQVVHALDQPIHLGLTRLESRHYISFYEKDDSHNKVLLDFAKLDFNLLQKLHQRELSEFTRWWKDLDVAGKLPFARDRVVELYFWILGVCYEPHYFFAIRILTRVIGLLSITDDMYDASDATIEELVLFHDAIQRWEVSAPDQLPDYMKHFYQKILDTYNMIDDEMAKQGRSYLVEYAKSALKDMVRVYLIEAKWYHEGYVPSMEEYMPVAGLSGGLRSLAIVSFVGMGELAAKEFEQERGHGASAVECYMKQYGATEEEIGVEFQKRVTDAWKDINSECLRPTAVPVPFLVRVLNLARTFHFVYKGGSDCYTNPGTSFKETVTSVLVDSLPI